MPNCSAPNEMAATLGQAKPLFDGPSPFLSDPLFGEYNAPSKLVKGYADLRSIRGGGFVWATSAVVWYALKQTVDI